MDFKDVDALELGYTKILHDELVQYSRTHYTVNYEEFTLEWVAEVLEHLRSAPFPISFTSLVRAEMPLFQLQDTYNEELYTTRKAVASIEKFHNMRDPPGRKLIKSERIAAIDAHSPIPIPDLPIDAMLTARSQRHTAALGKGHYKDNIPPTLSSVNTAYPQAPAKIDHDIEPRLPFGSLLNIDLETEVNPLFKLDESDHAFDDDSYISRFKLDDEVPVVVPEPHFRVLFPRNRRLGHSTAHDSIYSETRQDFPSHVPAQVHLPSSDDDIPRHNMRLVDGWQTVSSSPPCSPHTQNSSDDDMVDQLCFPSTPDTDPPAAEEIHRSRLDEPIFPRALKIGGKAGVEPHIANNKTAASFLLSMVPSLALPKIEVIDTVPSSPNPATSMIGQASLKDEVAVDLDFDVHTDIDIERLYQCVDPGIILHERIDEQSIILLEAPNLPEPTKHATPVWIPSSIHDLVTPSPVVDGEAPRPFAKKAAGRQSISLSLSWATFTVSEKLPPLSRILDIETPLESRYPELRASMVQDVEHLLQRCSATAAFDRPAVVAPYLGILSEEGLSPGEDPLKQSLLLLSRLERRRLDGKRDLDNEYDDSVTQVQNSTNIDPGPIHGPTKRLRRNSRSVEPPIYHAPDDRITDTCHLRNEGIAPGDEAEIFVESHGHYLQSQTSGLGGCPLPAVYSEEEKENWDPSFYMSTEYDLDLVDDLTKVAVDPFDRDLNGLSHRELEEEETFIELDQHADRDIFHPLSTDASFEYSMAGSAAQVEISGPSKNNASEDGVGDLGSGVSFDSLQAKQSIFNSAPGVLDFARLRAVKLSERHQQEHMDTTDDHTDPLSFSLVDEKKQTAPPEIFDRNTITLEEIRDDPSTAHYYMASLDVLQKRALTKSLRSICLVDFIERSTLSGVHLILDCSTAIIFVPLLTLSAACAAWIDLISSQSWKYTWIYVIFEAYPESCAYRSQERVSELYAYTPPILKAIKKFRRDIALSEAYNSKFSGCQVGFAFADSVRDAARFVRHIGDLAESRDTTGGAIWRGERQWLENEHESECDLATVIAMNHFSSALVLSQVGLEDFLGMTSQDRLDNFGPYLGIDTVATINNDIENRLQRSSMSPEELETEETNPKCDEDVMMYY